MFELPDAVLEHKTDDARRQSSASSSPLMGGDHVLVAEVALESHVQSFWSIPSWNSNPPHTTNEQRNGFMYICIVYMCACTPHNEGDVGMWCCSSFASVRLPDSATSNINQSYAFSNIFLYILGFCVGSGFIGSLDEDLTSVSL